MNRCKSWLAVSEMSSLSGMSKGWRRNKTNGLRAMRQSIPCDVSKTGCNIDSEIWLEVPGIKINPLLNNFHLLIFVCSVVGYVAIAVPEHQVRGYRHVGMLITPYVIRAISKETKGFIALYVEELTELTLTEKWYNVSCVGSKLITVR